MDSRKIETQFYMIRTLIAIGIALGCALIVILFVSQEPIAAITQFLIGPLTSFRRFANVVEMMIPLIFTGLAICVMFQANQFNLTGEGIFYFCGSMASLFAIHVILPPGIHSLAAILLAGLLGSLIAVFPIVLKLKWNANEVVSSIMMNFILLLAGLYVLKYFMKDPAVGYNASYLIPDSARLPGILAGTRIHAGFLVAVVAVVVVSLLLYKTKLGYEIRMTGRNIHFAKYSGIYVNSVIIYSQLIGGFLAGIGGAIEVLGLYRRFQWEVLTGYGYDGVLVAVLARNHPVFVPISAFFLAYMRVGADVAARTTDMPVEFVTVVQAIMLILVGAEMFLSSWKHKVIVKHSQKELPKKGGITDGDAGFPI